MDSWEREQLTKFKEERFLFCDAMMRADDGITGDRLSIDSWEYGYMQLVRMEKYLARMIELVRRVHVRRLDGANSRSEDFKRDES